MGREQIAILGEFEQVVLLAILRLEDNAYGVTIRKVIRECTGRNPAPGALYNTLDRLEEKSMLVAQFGYLLAACLVYVFLLFIVISILQVSFHSDLPGWGDASLQWSLVNLLAPLWLGRWMARRYGDRAAAGILALAFLYATIHLGAGLLLREAAADTSIDVILGLKLIYWDAASYRAVLDSAILSLTLYPVVVLAGAAFFRTSHAVRETIS